MHFIGKDITRFHCALWPAMLWAAGEEAAEEGVRARLRVPQERGDGRRSKRSASRSAMSIEPMEIISKFSAEAFRYYFLRECPFPRDGEFSWGRFAEVYNADLANNLGNLFSREMTLVVEELRRRARWHGGQERRNRSCRDSTSASSSARCAATSRRAGTTRRCRRSCRIPHADQPVPRSERAVETGEDRQGGGQAGAVQRGAVAAHRAASC